MAGKIFFLPIISVGGDDSVMKNPARFLLMGRVLGNENVTPTKEKEKLL
jgi:hypothetical protein